MVEESSKDPHRAGSQGARIASKADDARLDEPVFVTRPSLPPLADLIPMLEEIWSTRILTNMGPMHQRFEAAIAEYLGTPHVTLVTNASVGLMLALRHIVAPGDEVITTPFSFVATANAIVWSGATPVFVDVEPDSLNIDPTKIEQAITGRTKAILAVHCYGQPCRTEQIEAIARRYDLKIVYDAAHAFGARHGGRSLASYGEMAVLSFHATKVFNTFEGGAIVLADEQTKSALDRASNHGIVDETTVTDIGLNGKMNEFCAALGLLQLERVDRAIARRRELVRTYFDLLQGIAGVRCLLHAESLVDSNCYAFPILIGPECSLSRDALQALLRERNIHARRYFDPLISQMPMYRHLPSSSAVNLPVATALGRRVLCLPLFPDLDREAQVAAARVIEKAAARFS